jgi:hypothetical protein
MLSTTLLLAALLAPPASLPWVEDNYGQALAAARARKTPLFVEIWAPW